MRKIITLLSIITISITTASAQLKINKNTVSAATKVVQAATITDAQVEKYIAEYVKWLDENNPVCTPDDPYAIRLERIIAPIKSAQGINFKVYRVIDANAFACADGSVRIMAGIMDVMSDEELLGVIGHEIGHVRNKDTKDAFRTALLASALRDGVSATSGTAAALSGSQLGDLGVAVANSQFSQGQEASADEFGYNFLKEHNVNPWAMALAFERLKQMEQSAGAAVDSRMQQVLSSHPDLDARIKKMSDKATAEGFQRPVATASAQ